MQLIRGIHNIRPEHRGCVATIGNFDGVHLGHRTILDALKKKASGMSGAKVCVITFEPQPLEFFQCARSPARLTNLREKMVFFEEAGVDQVLCLPFNDKFSALSPEDFVMNVLVNGLDVRYLIVGDDFRYGVNREGGFKHLQLMGLRHGFEVCDTRTVSIGMERISSTRIRELLAADDLAAAEQLLARPLTMIGRVVGGHQLGRQMGFPTANIRVNRLSVSIQGVFAVNAWLEGTCYPAVANLGVRPTMNSQKPLLEVHLLNFRGDLYGQTLRIEFIKKIRNEKKFQSLDELRAAIAGDARVARSLFFS